MAASSTNPITLMASLPSIRPLRRIKLIYRARNNDLDDDIVSVVKNSFQSVGALVLPRPFTRATEAVANVQSWAPQSWASEVHENIILITTWEMPDMGILDFIERLKRREYSTYINIVVLDTAYNLGHYNECNNLGVQYFSEPLNVEQMRDIRLKILINDSTRYRGLQGPRSLSIAIHVKHGDDLYSFLFARNDTVLNAKHRICGGFNLHGDLYHLVYRDQVLNEHTTIGAAVDNQTEILGLRRKQAYRDKVNDLFPTIKRR